jgi:hypothetical protein
VESKRTKREAQWRTRISGWRNSGQSQARYCAEHGLCVSTLGYWIKRLREAHCDTVEGEDKLTLVAARPMHALFGSSTSSQLTLRSPSGWALMFERLPSASWLRELLDPEAMR